MHNERWLELALFPIAATTSRGRSTFEELMTERNNVFRKHPKTRFIAAHFGWHANDLAARREDAGRRSRTSPSKSARSSTTSAASRAPRTTSSSSIRTGSCSARTRSSPSEYPYYWRVFETNDEYFDYYRDYHAFWKLYGMGLPDAVLKKVYCRERDEVVKGMPQAGWPQGAIAVQALGSRL